MTRYTEKDAKTCFVRITAMQGKRIAKSWNEVGAWQLDCNTTYGGCSIEQIANKSGGVHTVTNRLPPKQFCEAVWFAEGINRKHQDLDGRKRRRTRR
jgi:hypothetical protein